MQHGVFEIRKQELFGISKCGPVNSSATLVFDSNIAFTIHFRKKPHVALLIATLPFGNFKR